MAAKLQIHIRCSQLAGDFFADLRSTPRVARGDQSAALGAEKRRSFSSAR
jgi:hypothetical protein